MWLFNRKSRRKDEFELEETLDSETVEVDSFTIKRLFQFEFIFPSTFSIK